jgi:hypothetical protein
MDMMQHNDEMEMIKKMPMDSFNSMDDVMGAASMTQKMG